MWFDFHIKISDFLVKNSELEKKSAGKWTRKEIPNWQQIWGE